MHYHEEDFWLLASLKLSGEATEEELTKLAKLIQQNPEMGLRLEMLAGMWKQRLAGNASDKKGVFERHLKRLSSQVSVQALQYEEASAGDLPAERGGSVSVFQKYRNLLWAGGVAASILVWWLFFFTDAEKNKPGIKLAQNTVYTKRASKSKIHLPDGTEVWLNADSKITYNEKFQGDFREVQLSGEAYFDVAKDIRHPFIIHTQTMDIKVLGTSFNVRSYPNERTTETALVRGSVEITLRNNPEKKIILKPNEKLAVENGGKTELHNPPPGKKDAGDDLKLTVGKLHYSHVDTAAIETLWVKNKLAFDGEPLEQIALVLERWFDVKIIVAGDKLKSKKYSAVFDGETLPEVMRALQLTGGFQYSIKKNEVIIQP
jgi:transmembrane sensor